MELERRIGLRRDAPRAPTPGPEWLGRLLASPPRNEGSETRPTLAYSKQKMVLTMGSTLHLVPKMAVFVRTKDLKVTSRLRR